MKIKYYITALCSHITVLCALLAPVIRVTETKMTSISDKTVTSSYLNVFEFLQVNLNSLSSAIMIILMVLHVTGVVNAIVGIVKKGYVNTCVSLTFICGLASAFMGALQLYSGSYVLFLICASSFMLISFCSIRLIKIEH